MTATGTAQDLRSGVARRTAPVPDLASYDLIVVSISGGKNSQVALDETVIHAWVVGVLDRVHTVFCDLGDADEWPGTRDLAAEHAAHYRLPHHVVYREVTGPDGVRRQQSLSEHIEARGKWPDGPRRYCTSDMKRAPVYRLMTRLVRETGITGRPKRVLNVLGLRADESPDRASKPAFAYNRRASGEGFVRQVHDWLPIHHYTLDQVWERISEIGTNRVYAGLPRLSCRFCVLAGKSALIRAAQLDPAGARERAEQETRMGHRLRENLSMTEIITAARQATGPVAVDDWRA